MMSIQRLFIFTILVIVCSSGLCLGQDSGNNSTTTLYVSPSSTFIYNNTTGNNTLCGNSIDTACVSIEDALQSFINSSFVQQFNQTYPNATILPPLVIELFAGNYYSQNSSSINATTSLSGMNVTIQPYPGEEVVLNGTYRESYTYLFELPNGIKSTLFGVLNFNNITFDHFQSGIVFVNSYYTMNISFVDCTIQNSLTSNILVNVVSSNSYSNVYFYNTNILGFSLSGIVLMGSGTFVFNNGLVNAVGSNNFFSIYNAPSTFINSIFSNNTLNSYTIYGIGGSINIQGCIFQDNTGGSSVIGGSGSVVLIDGSMFINNVGNNYGPVTMSEGSITITNTQFTDNSGFYGGAIYSDGSELSINGCTFKNNNGVYGMAINIRSNYFSLSNSQVTYSNAYDSKYTQNNLISLDSVNRGIFDNNTIAVGYYGVPFSFFSVLSCTFSDMEFDTTQISTASHDLMTCSDCRVINDITSNYTCPPTDSSSAQSSSSSSDNNNNRHKYPSNYKALVVFLVLFSVLLLVGIIIILTCYMKQRNQSPDGYKIIK